MGKSFSWSSKVLIAAHETVEDAKSMAMKLAWHECKGPGDFLEAMRRVAERIGVPYGTFWNLRYRKPKEIATHEYMGIFAEFAKNKHKYRAERDEVAEPSKVGTFLLRFADGAHRAAGLMAGEAGPPSAVGKDDESVA
jgi:hypothetical protein